MATKNKVPGKHIRDYQKSNAGDKNVSYCGEELKGSYHDSNYFVNSCHALENLGKEKICEGCKDVVIDILNGKLK